ncbi:Phytochelatin-domain-containing protein [Basidiobolus meristosporus CBS 931.73]|uniref:glutathione gamma-glutamylcysteinyltransferase n=1 Tax=Basidiobolus meristosporus CBS 931.73 TaxID=1314790 RepID=A0A1Y1YQ83_9FUNG|nr:Phytochelatin-domain-containing protein [Basidiobolus meristosporus CBS 931.73]|eukprot:ORY00139.1 Phytochelatin-domain-containing protein [Basidiobolus meristosporus CBS 931.73]
MMNSFRIVSRNNAPSLLSRPINKLLLRHMVSKTQNVRAVALNNLPLEVDQPHSSFKLPCRGDYSVLLNTHYRQKLPACLTSFTSEEGKQIFKESLCQGYAEGYFNLVGNFTTQSEPSYCGPSSLAMVLNAMEIDPKKRWKGNWRWYSEELLEGFDPAKQFKCNGVNDSEFLELAQNHCEVEAKSARDVTLQEFVDDLKRVCSRGTEHIVLSFSRRGLDQAGEGHFSPIGGYNADRQQVLIMDVTRSKYPSYYVSVERIYKSMCEVDKSTGLSRGYFILKSNREHTFLRPEIFQISPEAIAL